MFKRCLHFLFTLLFTFSIWAQSPEISSAAPASDFSLRAETTLPVFLGLGLGYSFTPQFDLAFYFGVTPELYYKLIGQVAAKYGGNDSYDDVIEAAFQNNRVIKAQGNYFFTKKGSGYNLGMGFYQVTSSGQAEIDTVLAASTGEDYTTLKNLLIALGRSTQVDLNGTLQVFEIRGGYDWSLSEKSILRAFAGVAKVTTADIKLKTGLNNFEASQAGSTLMRQSESDLEKIIIDNGLSPIVGLDYQFQF